MEFSEKLQELRQQKGLTQQELAEALFVSRTAVSKWESGRGYPSIDSLKSIAVFFGVTVDELLSGNELLNIAEQDTRQKENYFRDLVFGLLDICVAIFFFMPFFGQRMGGAIQEVSLLSLTETAPYLKICYFAVVSAIILSGILTLALQNCQKTFWVNNKSKISLSLNEIGVVLFIIGQQPYAAVLLFVFSIIKSLVLLKK